MQGVLAGDTGLPAPGAGDQGVEAPLAALTHRTAVRAGAPGGWFTAHAPEPFVIMYTTVFWLAVLWVGLHSCRGCAGHPPRWRGRGPGG